MEIIAKKEMIPLSESELKSRATQEQDSRPERLERLRGYISTLFPEKEQQNLREQVEESFNVPQWGKYHNEGLLMDTHLALIIERIEAIAAGSENADKALEGLKPAIAVRIKNAITSNREMILRYTLLHDLEKRATIGLNKKNEKGKRVTENMSWEEWQKILAQYPDPSSLRTYFQEQKIESIGYHDHGEKGAALSENIGIDARIVKAIRFHELGFNADAKTKTLRSREPIESDDIDFIVAVNFLDQSSSLREDGTSDVSMILRVERLIENIRTIQAIEILHKEQDLSGYDAEDVKKAIDNLEKRSDDGERLTNANEERASILAANKLKNVDSEKLKSKLQALISAKNLTVENDIIQAILDSITDPERRIQPEKAGSKSIFSKVQDKKLAAAIKTIFVEAVSEAIIQQ